MPRVAREKWLFSPAVDGAAFFGTAVAAAALAAVAWAAGWPTETPLWAWLVLVLGLDVTHVWATLYRVYFDADEIQRRPTLYVGAPFIAYALGLTLCLFSLATFWRALAYVAAWHFIRQQVGWAALYARRANDTPWQRRFDAFAIYAATLGPFIWWHANLPRPFAWFVDGDFVPGLPHVVGDVALWLHAAVLLGWLVHQLLTKRHVGKMLLLGATSIAWFGGIVLARSDFAFTVLNVALHAVPYLVLLHRYAQGRRAEGGYGRWAVLLRGGAFTFIGVLLALAFIEELGWDTLVWHERPEVFGHAQWWLSDSLLCVVVPLLSLPQTTHYLLDGFVWGGRHNPFLSKRLGWSTS